MDLANNNNNNTTNSTASDDTTVISDGDRWKEIVIIFLIYGTTFVIGLIGNCLIIFTTFRYRRMQNVTNVFLSSLASADLLLIIVCIPVKVAKLYSYTWTMGMFVCKSVHYMQNMSAICSVFTLTAISIERYYAIVHPMKAKYICTISQAQKIIFVIWVLSMVLAVPTLFAQVLLPTSDANYFHCMRNVDKDYVWKFHEIYMLLVIAIFPFCIMSYSYSLICWEVWKVMERRFVMTSKQALRNNHNNLDDDRYMENFTLTSEDKHKKLHKLERDDTHMVKQVICMLVTVVVLFAICWTPILVDNVLRAFEVLPLISGPLKHLNTACTLLAYVNSCINPIIYGFMSKNFRESFFIALCCSSELRTHRGSSYSLRFISRTGSQTRNTSLR